MRQTIFAKELLTSSLLLSLLPLLLTPAIGKDTMPPAGLGV